MRHLTGGPAFPVPPVVNDETKDIIRGEPGMSLRDWFAGQALAGLLANPRQLCVSDNVVTDAYIVADGMLKERATV